MREMIGRKIYDTSKAELVFEETGWDKFGMVTEHVYRTTKGNWFVHRKNCAVPAGPGDRGWYRGEEIVPLSKDDVPSWLEGHDRIDLLEELYPGYLEEA